MSNCTAFIYFTLPRLSQTYKAHPHLGDGRTERTEKDYSEITACAKRNTWYPSASLLVLWYCRCAKSHTNIKQKDYPFTRSCFPFQVNTCIQILPVAAGRAVA